MPKRRSDTISVVANNIAGAIGASGSGLSNNIIEQLARRVNNRLRETMIVEMESRSRGRIENVTINYRERDNLFDVNSGEGSNEYQVNIEERSCTCADNRYRGSNCRHLRAVDEVLGQVTEEVRELSEGDITRMRISQDIRDEIDRNTSGDSRDDGFFYLDNPEEFDRTFENINEDLVRYEYENVLNGNDSTFGIELEFVGGDANAIARALYDLGIVSDPQRLGYHARQTDKTKWKVERDGSVSDGPCGGEIVSPILKDTPETWRQIEVICEVVKRHGGRVDHRCGGHVHVGMNKLDTARQRWRRFFKIVENYEQCFYRVAGGDLGRVRSNADGYANPFSDRAAESARMRLRMDENDDVKIMAREVSNGDRYYGINLTNIATGRAPTVEMRYFNGSLNPKQIQANIKLSVGIINAAEKARWRDTEDENFKKRGGILKNTSRLSGTKTKEKMMELIDLAFTRKSDKDAIINVFKKNRWR